MDYTMLKLAAASITMTEERKQRVVERCKTQMKHSGKELNMHTKNCHIFSRKPAAVLAVVVICLSLSAAALAAAEKGRGFFRDIADWRGAIVGTSYEQATDEVWMNASVNDGQLTVLAVFSEPGKAPYREAETLGIAEYQIVDADGRPVQEGSTASAEIVNGQAAIDIQLDGMGSGKYRLVVTALYTEKKADQPLTIHGSWECTFTL